MEQGIVTPLTVAAVDLGAESGRVTRADFDGTRIELEIETRFRNDTDSSDGHLRWDFETLWGAVHDGLSQVGAATDVASVGVDSWGVDYGLLSYSELVENPRTYRDAGRARGFELAMQTWGPAPFYDATGAQLHEINTIYGLIDDARRRPDVLRSAEKMLMIPDLLHHRLSGTVVSEYTVATTTGMFDIAHGRWASDLLELVDLPQRLLPEVVAAGTDLGPLLLGRDVAGLKNTRVIAPASHDTASAVAAIPRLDPSTMFISSGTWSLAGVVLPHPVIGDDAKRANLTNEGAYGGGVRYLRDIVGLWVLQECRRQWQREGADLTYDHLTALAGAEEPLVSFVDLESGEFLAPGDMPARIAAACTRGGLATPTTPGQITRAVIDSLALAYRGTLEDIERTAGTRIEGIAVVGGGIANAELQRATASATGRPVTCWAREATALGNAAVQLAALGELQGLDQIWDVIAAGTTPTVYEPRDQSRWAEAAARLTLMRQAEHHDTTPTAPDR